MTDPTPAEALKARATPICGYCHAEVPGDLATMREHIRRSHNGNYSAPPLDVPQPPAADAGEVRTYREGVEDAAALIESRRKAGNSLLTIAWNRAMDNLAAAIRKLGS